MRLEAAEEASVVGEDAASFVPNSNIWRLIKKGRKNWRRELEETDVVNILGAEYWPNKDILLNLFERIRITLLCSKKCSSVNNFILERIEPSQVVNVALERNEELFEDNVLLDDPSIPIEEPSQADHLVMLGNLVNAWNLSQKVSETLINVSNSIAKETQAEPSVQFFIFCDLFCSYFSSARTRRTYCRIVQNLFKNLGKEELADLYSNAYTRNRKKFGHGLGYTMKGSSIALTESLR